jgi:hypothetical protein
MALETPPLKSYPIDEFGNMSQDWSRWFTRVWNFASSIGSSGATINRPTTGLYIGLQFFDTTLGYPIWVSSVTAGVATWVNGSGASV